MEWMALAEQVANLTPDAFRQLWEQSDPATRKALLRARFRFDRAGFLKWCFPEIFGRPFNRYHCEVLDRPWRPWQERTGRVWQEADAAPRGIAKTTLLKGEVVWAIIYAMEAYVVWLSAELRLARDSTRHLRHLFQRDGHLSRLYGPFAVSGGIDEWSVTVNGATPVGVLARSFGTQLRGANEGGARPTLVVVDDGERPDRVRNADQRRIWWAYLHEDVLKVGPIEGGLWVRIRGTVLHPDSMLANLLKSTAWKANKYKVLNQLSASPLWERCKAIYTDLSLGDEEIRRECALAFYKANQAEMDAGLEVLDPEVMGPFRVYELIWTQGLQSVLKELFNEPRQAGTRFFETGKFRRCRVEGTGRERMVLRADGRRVALADLSLRMHLDPIPGTELGVMGDDGGSGGGDFAACVLLGRDSDGYTFVLDCWMGRGRDSEIRRRCWSMAENWGCKKLGVEANGFQRLFARDFKKERAKREEEGRFWQLHIDEDHVSLSKEDRIAALEAPTSNGEIQFAEGLTQLLFQQFDDFPDGDHDDGPDALASCYRLLPALRKTMLSQEPLRR